MTRHRKPSLATAIRVTGALAAGFQVTGLALVIIGGGGGNSIAYLGIFCMTLACLAVVAHVIYRRTPTVAATRSDSDLIDEVPTSLHEMPTIPGLNVSANPAVTTVKVTPRKRSHHRVESKK